MPAKFRTTRPNSCIILADGEKICFVGTYLLVDNDNLADQIRNYIKATKDIFQEVDPLEDDFVDPIEKIKKKAVEEFLASQKPEVVNVKLPPAAASK